MTKELTPERHTLAVTNLTRQDTIRLLTTTIHNKLDALLIEALNLHTDKYRGLTKAQLFLHKELKADLSICYTRGSDLLHYTYKGAIMLKATEPVCTAVDTINISMEFKYIIVPPV